MSILCRYQRHFSKWSQMIVLFISLYNMSDIRSQTYSSVTRQKTICSQAFLLKKMLSLGKKNKKKIKTFFFALLDSPTGTQEIKLTKDKLMRGKKSLLTLTA